jgi:hypothetical protein
MYFFKNLFDKYLNEMLQLIDFKTFLHLENPIWNLFFQCEIWKLKHINVEVQYVVFGHI